MAFRPKTSVTLKMHGEAVSHARIDLSVRDITYTVDEPLDRGGTNLGPSPTESLIGALAACSNVITHKIAKKHGVDIKALAVDIEYDFDRRGVLLIEEVDNPFPKLVLTISLTTDADDSAVESIKKELAMYCPVSKVIRNSGTEIVEVWNVSRP